MVDENLIWETPDDVCVIHRGRNSVYRFEYSQKHAHRPHTVAVKRVQASEGIKEDAAMRAVCNLDSSLTHLYHYQEVNDTGYLFMEYADYGNAAKLLEAVETYEHKYGEGELLKVSHNLLKALAMMHSQGWAHRDVKPANILVFADGTVKLCDFGAAKFLSAKDVRNSVVGTQAFMPPELEQPYIRGEQTAIIDPFKSDVYGLGYFLFQLASGAELSDWGTINSQSLGLLIPFMKASLEEYSDEFQTLLIDMVHPNMDIRIDSCVALNRVCEMLRVSVHPRVCVGCNGTEIQAALCCEDLFCKKCLVKSIERQAGNAKSFDAFVCAVCNTKMGTRVVMACCLLLRPETQTKVKSLLTR